MKHRHPVVWAILAVLTLALIGLSLPGCDKTPQCALEVEWERTFGASEDASGLIVEQTWDGGYVIVAGTDYQMGYGSGPGTGGVRGGDVWLIKTDSNGNPEWGKNKPGEWWRPTSVQQTSDGGFIFGLNRRLIKTDATGNEEWDKTFYQISTVGISMQQTSDGGYIILGSEMFWGHGGWDAWLIKTDSAGNEEWEKRLGNGIGRSVWQTSDGGYIILCEGRLIKTDSTGKEEWDATIDNGGISVKQSADGGYVILGENSESGVWLMKTNSNLYAQWHRTLDRRTDLPPPFSAQQVGDGGYLIIGCGQSLQSGEPWLKKVDSNGDLEWKRTLSGSGSIVSVRLTSDGGYVFVGSKEDATTGKWDVWLTKVKCTPP